MDNLEVVLVDDNPPESRVRSDRGVMELARDPRVRIVEHSTPLNAARARNMGLNAAAGDWVTFLDDDDAYLPHKLERQLAALESGEVPACLCGWAYELGPRRRLKSYPGDRITVVQAFDGGIAMPALMHRRTSSVRFDESLFAAEDAHYFFLVCSFYGLKALLNIDQILVSVFLQTGQRVNTQWQAHYAGLLRIHAEFGSLMPRASADRFLIKAMIARDKVAPNSWVSLLKGGSLLLLRHGLGEWRFVVNSLLYRIPVTRRFVVS